MLASVEQVPPAVVGTPATASQEARETPRTVEEGAPATTEAAPRCTTTATVVVVEEAVLER
jgi:hypothetical protein